jgi:NAD(P) transhydrogenase subunit beta
MNPALVQQFIDSAYIVATVFFILSIKWLSSPTTARRGVLVGEIAAALAVIATLSNPELTQYKWIVISLIIGAAVGIPLGMVQMTAVPQRTALSHAFGALSAAMIGIAEYYVGVGHLTRFGMGEIALEVIIGSLTFTGSVIAAGKLQEILPQRPIVYKGQNIVSLSVLAGALLLAVALVVNPSNSLLFPIMVSWRFSSESCWSLQSAARTCPR